MINDLKLCVMYVRVSSDDQRDGFSIPAQIELLVDYARAHDMHIVRVFEESMSAKASGRIEFNRMLKYLKNHPEVRSILVEKTDRLYRNFKDYATLDDSKYEIHLVKENEVLSKDSTSHQKLIHGLKVLLAKNFIDNLREETRKGRKKKAEEGYIVGGAPYGYKKLSKTEAKIQEHDGEFVKKAYELYATGKYSLEQTRQKLHQLGYIYKEHQPFIHKSQLHRFLSNVYYTGRVPFEGDIFPGKFPPIIDLETFNRVQTLLRREKATTYEYLFLGLIRCGRCNHQITGETRQAKNGTKTFYHCTGGNRNCKQRKIVLTEEYVERAIQRALNKIALTEENTAWLFDRLKGEMDHTKVFSTTDKNAMIRELEKLNTTIDQLYADRLDKKISEDLWQRKTQELDKRASEIKMQLEGASIVRKGDISECIQRINNIGLLAKMFKEGGAYFQKAIPKLVFSSITLKGHILSFEYAWPFRYFLEKEDIEIQEGEFLLQ